MYYKCNSAILGDRLDERTLFSKTALHLPLRSPAFMLTTEFNIKRQITIAKESQRRGWTR